MAFGANSAAGQYMAAQGNVGPSVNILSCHPNAGGYGTKMMLKMSSPYDVQTMTGTGPYAYISFGSHRAIAQILKDSHHSNGACTYTISADVPQFISTNFPSPNNVPLGLIIESGNGEELAHVDNAGVFTYLESHGAAGAPGSTEGSTGDVSAHEELTRKSSESPEQRASPPQGLSVSTATTTSPSSSYNALPADPSTNSYGYPPAVAAAAAEAQAEAQQAHSNFGAAGYTQGTNSMLGTYRTSTLADHYSRAPPPLRSSRGIGWTPYGSAIGTVRSPATTIAHGTHTGITRPSLTPLPRPSGGVPQLIRTSTLGSPPGAGLAGNSAYNPYAIFPAKATLKINGDLESMAENWTQEEWDNRRRIVLFKKSQQGSQLQTSFRPVAVDERPPNSTCISCIWWAEKQECFVTSVDTIYLLEQLVASPARFTVEEKNRIRRNLEGFHPLTVSKTKSESAEFFKVIMAFGNPKPRNIEKDVKVFPWKILGQALKKIISKYSASPSTTMAAPPSHHQSHLLTPISIGGSYPNLPPTPGSATAATDHATATGYITSAHHHADSLPSPRHVSGVSSSWAPYSTGPSRPLSPGLKTHSPGPSSGLRISTLATTYDGRGSNQAATSPYGYGLPTSSSQSQHPHHNHNHNHAHHHQNGQSYSQPPVPVTQSHHGRIWDGYTVAGGYPSHANHSAHGQAYGNTGGYSDAMQRV